MTRSDRHITAGYEPKANAHAFTFSAIFLTVCLAGWASWLIDAARRQAAISTDKQVGTDERSEGVQQNPLQEGVKP